MRLTTARRVVRLVVGGALAVSLAACSDDAPTDSGSDGAGLSDGGGATSVPGNEPGDGASDGLNQDPDTGGDDGTGEDTTGGQSPAGGTTGDPE